MRSYSHLLKTRNEYFAQEGSFLKFQDLAESSSPEFDQNSEIKEHIEEEEVTEIMAETMEQNMSKTRDEIGSGVARPTIDADIQFKLKGQFLKELRDNTFNGLEHKDANEHIKKF
ncbi:hypothetical protein Tco_0110117 [Tanacetum coccineum]